MRRQGRVRHVSILTVIALGSFAGCDLLRNVSPNTGTGLGEYLNIEYALVPASGTRYAVPSDDDGIDNDCRSPVIVNYSLQQIVNIIEMGTAPGRGLCLQQWRMRQADVDAARAQLLEFSMRMPGSVLLFVGRGSTPQPGPTGTQFFTGGAMSAGQSTTNGEMEWYGLVPNTQDVFQCVTDGRSWTNNLQVASPTFFQTRLRSVDQNLRVAEGSFKCIARNISDPTDTRLLLIRSGEYRARLR